MKTSIIITFAVLAAFLGVFLYGANLYVQAVNKDIAAGFITDRRKRNLAGTLITAGSVGMAVTAIVFLVFFV